MAEETAVEHSGDIRSEHGLSGILTHKLGPLPAWAWGLGLVGMYVLYRWYAGRATTSGTSGGLVVNPSLAPTGGGSGTPGPLTNPAYDSAIAGLTQDVQTIQASLQQQGTAFTQLQSSLAAQEAQMAALQGQQAPQNNLADLLALLPLFQSQQQPAAAPIASYQPAPPPAYTPQLPAYQQAQAAPLPAFQPQPTFQGGSGLGYLGTPLGQYESFGGQAPVPQAVGSIPFQSGPFAGQPTGIYNVQQGPNPVEYYGNPQQGQLQYPTGSIAGPTQQGNTGSGFYVTLPGGEQIWQAYGAPPAY